MKFYGEMRVQGGGPLDGARFDALAYALAEIEATDPAIEEVDLTSSLSQGWVTASMTISQENLELAVAKLIATVRTAIYPNGDHAGGWQFLTETAGLSVHPATDRAGAHPPGQTPPSGTPAPPARPAPVARRPAGHAVPAGRAVPAGCAREYLGGPGCPAGRADSRGAADRPRRCTIVTSRFQPIFR